MDFEYPEDLKYFADIFCNGDIARFKAEYRDYFDFRDPAVKRREFNLIRNKVFKDLVKKHGRKCQLKLLRACDNEDLVVDHFIPLSSNKLNKKLRDLKPVKGKKVQTQSFGSNNPKNFILACTRCNSFKKHKIMIISTSK